MRALVVLGCISVWCVLLSVTPAARGQAVEADAAVTELAARGVCRLPIKTGPCRGAFPRYAFNRTVGQCLPFTYGGCGGNGNNFATLSKCSSTCPDRCPSGAPGVRCFAAPCSVNSCPAFPEAQCFNNYCGGCNAIFVLPNGRHLSAEECAAPPPRARACQQPIVSGPCLAYMPRYAFDSAEGQCRPFVYGGCGGNANNFHTRDQCVSTCPDLCPPDKPPFMCIAMPCFGATCPAMPDAQCISSYCGGCKAIFVQDGRVLSASECAIPSPPTLPPTPPTPSTLPPPPPPPTTSTLPPPPPTPSTLPPAPPVDVCTLPVAGGPCEALMRRYAFNSSSGQCEQFIYGGCEGNGNNFETLSECSARCPPVPPPPRCVKCPVTPCAVTLCTGDSRCVNDFCKCRGICVKIQLPPVEVAAAAAPAP